jgi:hypothetical protein
MRKPKTDWSKVDWSKSTKQIAEEVGVIANTVSTNRGRFAPQTLGLTNQEKAHRARVARTHRVINKELNALSGFDEIASF